jgi:hypothetical protein
LKCRTAGHAVDIETAGQRQRVWDVVLSVVGDEWPLGDFVPSYELLLAATTTDVRFAQERAAIVTHQQRPNGVFLQEFLVVQILSHDDLDHG